MDIFQAAVLALVQGATEFLPVSSSAHLVLAPVVLGWQDQGHVFDVAVHVGTLAAVLFHFRRDLGLWLTAVLHPRDPQGAGSRRLLLWLFAATAPIVLAGPLLYGTVTTVLRDLEVIAWTTIGFGILLWVADSWRSRQRDLGDLRMVDAIGIGAAQCLAIVPGVSRAGIVMTAALLLGLQRTAAARVAFLLAIPAIVGAGSLSAYQVSAEHAASPGLAALLTGVLVAAVSAGLCIHLFLRLIEKIGMLPFALYRLALGGLLLLFVV